MKTVLEFIKGKLATLIYYYYMTGPNQRNIPVQIQKAPGGVNVSFSSTSVGEYTIDVQVKNQRLAGAPFRCVSCDNEASFVYFVYC